MYDKHYFAHMCVLILVQTLAVRQPSAVVFHPPQMVLPVQQELDPHLLVEPPPQILLVLLTRHRLMVWECLLLVQHSSALL